MRWALSAVGLVVLLSLAWYVGDRVIYRIRFRRW